MALELASKSVIFHQKLEEYDQILDLAPSRVLPHPSCWVPAQKEDRGTMLGHKVADLDVLIDF